MYILHIHTFFCYSVFVTGKMLSQVNRECTKKQSISKSNTEISKNLKETLPIKYFSNEKTG